MPPLVPLLIVLGASVGWGCASASTRLPAPQPARLNEAASESASARVAPSILASTPSPGLRVGDAFVDVGLRPLDGATGALGPVVWLSDFVGVAAKSPARLLLLSFFASYCAPCFTELPELAVWQARYRAHGLQVVGINVRPNGKNVADEIAATRARLGALPPFPLLFSRYTNESSRLYLGDAAVALPALVLFDAAGRVLRREHGSSPEGLHALERFIADHLSGLQTEETSQLERSESRS